MEQKLTAQIAANIRYCVVCGTIIDFDPDDTTNEVCSEQCNDVLVTPQHHNLIQSGIAIKS